MDAATQPKRIPRVSTGISGLDDILAGGLPAGHFYLVEGDPGSGKTTLGLQFLLNGVARGEKVLYVTLSESVDELRAVAASHGFDVGSMPMLELLSEEALKPETQYTVFHPSEIELADTIKTIITQVDKLGPSRLVIDSVSELRMLAHDTLRYRRQILALKRFFEDRQCTVLLLDDRSSEHLGMQLFSIVHGVINMEKVPREYGVTRRRLEIPKLRGSLYREGYHDYRIRYGGVDVYPRLVSAEHNPGFKPRVAKSGIPELDDLLGGGLDHGTSTLLVGPAGCGKSTLALKFAHNACLRGEIVCMYTFEEGTHTVLSRAAGLGMDLRPMIADRRMRLEQIDPAELSPGEFVQKVRNAIEKEQARVVIIDSLNGFLQAMPGEEFLAIQLHETLSYLNQLGVLTLMVLAQAGVIGTSMQAPADVSYLADNILLLRYFEVAGAVRKAISVVKKRSGSHEQTIRELMLLPGRVTVGKPLTQFHGVLTGVPAFLGGEATGASGND
jgi:circadian clock protein KaiC